MMVVMVVIMVVVIMVVIVMVVVIVILIMDVIVVVVLALEEFRIERQDAVEVEGAAVEHLVEVDGASAPSGGSWHAG